jgi:hypothetical protein
MVGYNTIVCDQYNKGMGIRSVCSFVRRLLYEVLVCVLTAEVDHLCLPLTRQHGCVGEICLLLWQVLLINNIVNVSLN